MNYSNHSILPSIVTSIKNTDANATAILYGSRANGKALKGSDWDILILVDKLTVDMKEEQAFRHGLYDIELETGEVISTLVYTTKDWNTKLKNTPLHHTVEKEGVKL